MGAGSSFDEHVRAEFASLVGSRSRDYVVLHELQQLSNASVDFSHLGTLFALNASRSGRVHLDELLRFVVMCQEQHRLYAPHEFKARLQAFCSLQMWRFATECDANREAVVDWFVLLLTESALIKKRDSTDGDREIERRSVEWAVSSAASAAPGRVEPTAEPSAGPQRDGVVYVDLDAIELLHRLFHIQRTHAIDFQTFLDMMQQVGEEMGKMDLDDQRYDYVVPIDVLRKFASDMLNGALQLIAELLIDAR